MDIVHSNGDAGCGCGGGGGGGDGERRKVRIMYGDDSSVVIFFLNDGEMKIKNGVEIVKVTGTESK